tara:strand:+ start:458 stop:1423 length:966 start_codon:yes stop_codon:yes gene_type:complete
MGMPMKLPRRGTLGLTSGVMVNSAISPSFGTEQPAQSNEGMDPMHYVPGRIAGPTQVPVKRQYLDGRFGQIHYRIAAPLNPSKKRPVICLHMSPNSGRVFEHFLGFLGSDRLCIAPDTPGFGDSDPPKEKPTINDYAGAIGDVIDSLELSEVDLIGYHTGSETAIEVAHQKPGSINRIVIVSAPIFTDGERIDLKKHYSATKVSIDGSHIAEKWVAHAKWRMKGWTLDHLAYQFNDALRRPDISWWGHSAAFEYPMKERLQTTTKEVLVLNPEDDLNMHTKRATGLSSKVKILDLPGWNHGFLDIKTQEAVAIVQGHFDDV